MSHRSARCCWLSRDVWCAPSGHVPSTAVPACSRACHRHHLMLRAVPCPTATLQRQHKLPFPEETYVPEERAAALVEFNQDHFMRCWLLPKFDLVGSRDPSAIAALLRDILESERRRLSLVRPPPPTRRRDISTRSCAAWPGCHVMLTLTTSSLSLAGRRLGSASGCRPDGRGQRQQGVLQ